MLDTHCHIDEEAFAADREEVIARQRAAGVEAMIVPGVNVASIDTVLEVCHQHPGYCFPALGLHPEDVKADWQTALETVETAIRAHRSELVAIGEIGLDYYWDKTYKAEQQEVLRRQLLLARELDLPVILHNREATEDIVRLVHEAANYKLQITNYKLKPLRGVFHCFNGSKETAQLGLECAMVQWFNQSYLVNRPIVTSRAPCARNGCSLYGACTSSRRTQREPFHPTRSRTSRLRLFLHARCHHRPNHHQRQTPFRSLIPPKKGKTFYFSYAI